MTRCPCLGKSLHKRRCSLCLSALVGASAAVAATVQLQVVVAQQRPTFRTGVDLVEIQVTATDKDGRPVRGLKAEDFVVLENGVARPVVGFEAVSLTPPALRPVSYPAKFPQDIADNATSSAEMLVAL